MNTKDFDILVARVFSAKTELLKSKGKIYGSDQDRLSQFKLMGELSGLTPAQCAFILASKHFTALKNVLFQHSETLTLGIVDEITGDLINYMLLIQAICEDKLNEPTANGPAIVGHLSSDNMRCSCKEQQVPKQTTWSCLGEK